jgi:hypothetical protein
MVPNAMPPQRGHRAGTWMGVALPYRCRGTRASKVLKACAQERKLTSRVAYYHLLTGARLGGVLE